MGAAPTGSCIGSRWPGLRDQQVQARCLALALPLKMLAPGAARRPGGRRTGRAAFFQGTWMSLGKIATTPAWRVSSDRGRLLSFGYLFFAAFQRKVTRQRRKRLKPSIAAECPSARRRAGRQRDRIFRRRGYLFFAAFQRKVTRQRRKRLT